MELEEKVAIVTGAGRGIGRAIALSLAREGAFVVVNDVDEANMGLVVKEIRKLGRKAQGFKADVTLYGEVAGMVETVIEKFGRINILVNNAGVVSVASILELDERVWEQVISVNTKGVFNCCKAVVKHMIKQGNGKIINIASEAGKRGYPFMAHYCASKFAVIGFTQAIALELANYNICVNAVCPGIVVPTKMQEYIDREFSRREGLRQGESLKRKVEQIPLGRPTTPEDIARVVVFLASSKSNYLTGQSINVSGGTTMH